MLSRVGAPLGALIFALPLVGTWSNPALPWSTAALLAVLMAVTLARPATGLVLFAGIFPMTPALTLAMGQPASELVVLSFLVAALLHAVAAPAPSSALARPATLLGAVLLGSMLILLSSAQLWWGELRPFVRALADDTVWTYFAPEGFTPVKATLPWLEAVVLAVVAEGLLRGSPHTARAAVRMFLVAGTGQAVFTGVRLAEISLRREAPVAAAIDFASRLRFNVFFADVNAAGSLLVLFLVPVVWLAWRRSLLWIGPALPLALAVWLTGSRAAFGGAVAALGVLWTSAYRPRWRTVAAVSVVAFLLLVVITTVSGRNVSITKAGGFRMELFRAGVTLVAERPIFGVGLNMFKPASARTIPPEFARRFRGAERGENAHNNFLQVLVELGVVGFVAFVWFAATPFAAALARGWQSPDAAPEAMALSGGLLALLLSALLGHPLLENHIRAACFLAVGLVAGMTAAPPARSRWPGVAVALGVVVIALTMPWRLREQRLAEPLGGLVRGATEVQDPLDGVSYRLADRHSSWYFAGRDTAVLMPFRARSATGTTCEVEVTIDGRRANRLHVNDGAWQRTLMQLPPVPATHAWRRLDLDVLTGGCTLLVGTIERK